MPATYGRVREATNLNFQIMEQINRIEIKGKIGNVRITDFEDGQSANLSVATNYIYKSRDGHAVIETMWFNVCAWKGRNMPEDFKLLQKGKTVHVTGRMREREFTGADGAVKKITEVIASRMEIVEDED